MPKARARAFKASRRPHRPGFPVCTANFGGSWRSGKRPERKGIQGKGGYLQKALFFSWMLDFPRENHILAISTKAPACDSNVTAKRLTQPESAASLLAFAARICWT
ncbi:MAG: hypothetical protein LBJ59_06895 [Zoogloeaceae bacterium]|nr:hypothetical protein [Zoogloeaceae bacterium]